MTIDEIKEKAKRVRRQVIRMAHEGKTSHVGSALSCVDILAVLYLNVLNCTVNNWQKPEASRFILSKGHAAKALYAVLAEAGFISMEDLSSYAKDGTAYGEHPSHKGVPGISVSTGSLGHGLAIGAGQALAKKLDGRQGHVFVLLSDGECNEGSIWEAAMCASAQKLDNLIVIIDDNHMQAMGPSRAISGLDPLADKWKAFGWNVKECDGHDVKDLIESCTGFLKGNGRPSVIVARTVLGKGVSFMEDKILWHYQIPSAQDMSIAFKELDVS